MPVTVRMFCNIATVKDYEWHCDNPKVLDLLNATLEPDGPSGADPDPDYSAAEEAIRFYGHGQIIEHVVIQSSEPTPGSSSQ
ncbi:hypothetical protein EON83_26325 [bacterium]|nr:MAG: hypothetical protein EON83_26325 [bacterium]